MIYNEELIQYAWLNIFKPLIRISSKPDSLIDLPYLSSTKKIRSSNLFAVAIHLTIVTFML